MSILNIISIDQIFFFTLINFKNGMNVNIVYLYYAQMVLFCYLIINQMNLNLGYLCIFGGYYYFGNYV